MPVIAIDGPGGAGKSTVARALARRLGIERLDTGAMYRAVTLAAMRKGIDPSDGEELASLARSSEIDVGDHVILDGEDVSLAIRSDDVTALVSAVSAHGPVRAELVSRQRAWVAARRGGVVEGRDIGSVVLPDADLKIFLTADPIERARRRAGEHHASDASVLQATLASIEARDAADSTRAASPLHIAPDAVVIDTTARTVDDVVDGLLALL